MEHLFHKGVELSNCYCVYCVFVRFELGMMTALQSAWREAQSALLEVGWRNIVAVVIGVDDVKAIGKHLSEIRHDWKKHLTQVVPIVLDLSSCFKPDLVCFALGSLIVIAGNIMLILFGCCGFTATDFSGVLSYFLRRKSLRGNISQFLYLYPHAITRSRPVAIISAIFLSPTFASVAFL